MGKLVGVFGVTHSPLFARIKNPKFDSPAAAKVREQFEKERAELDKARPDVLLCIANDHLGQFFLENMPPFLIGKSPVARGTFPWERHWGAPDYVANVDVDLARNLIQRGFDHGVDFAFSDEFHIDHAFTMPLDNLRPERDLPIVPIFCNVMAPPIPPAKRFFAIGEAIGRIIGEYPKETRVAVVSSGHLSVEIGGPREPSPDAEFDFWATRIVGEGDVDQAVHKLTMDRLLKAGNYTAGFLTFVPLMGIVGGKPASFWDCMDLTDTVKCRIPFFRWTMD
jgi:protocatechuate 4,5-dioxygenase, beta chain